MDPLAKSILDSACKSARSKANAARALLSLCPTKPEQVALMLSTGWQEVSRAINSVKPEPASYIKETWLNIIPTGSFTMTNNAEFSNIPIDRWLEAVRNLDEAIVCLTRFRKQLKGNHIQRFLFNAFRAILVILGLAAIALISIGIYKLVNAPKPDEGLLATYFLEENLNGHHFKRIEHFAEFHWDKTPPVRGLSAGGFSLLLEGCLSVSQKFPIYLVGESDFPLSVHVDGRLALTIQDKAKSTASAIESTTPLLPGLHQIRIELPRCRAPGKMNLSWTEKPRGKRESFLAKQWIPKGGNRLHSCKDQNVSNSANAKKKAI